MESISRRTLTHGAIGAVVGVVAIAYLRALPRQHRRTPDETPQQLGGGPNA